MPKKDGVDVVWSYPLGKQKKIVVALVNKSYTIRAPFPSFNQGKTSNRVIYLSKLLAPNREEVAIQLAKDLAEDLTNGTSTEEVLAKWLGVAYTGEDFVILGDFDKDKYSLPEEPGVVVVRRKFSQEILYVGEADRIRSMVVGMETSNGRYVGADPVFKALTVAEIVISVEYLITKSPRERKFLWARLITENRPAYQFRPL